MNNPPRIEDSYEKLDKYPTVVERYYSKYYFTPETLPPEETHCILIHSNRICLVSLAENHPIVKHQKKISKIDFQVTDKLDRLQNKVVGKGKKGAQFITQTSRLCFVECTDGTRYTIYGCVKGKLIEINEQLVSNNQLLVEKPLSDGFVAIILPHLKDVEEQKKGFELCKKSTALQNDSELLDIDAC